MKKIMIMLFLIGIIGMIFAQCGAENEPNCLINPDDIQGTKDRLMNYMNLTSEQADSIINKYKDMPSNQDNELAMGNEIIKLSQQNANSGGSGADAQPTLYDSSSSTETSSTQTNDDCTKFNESMLQKYGQLSNEKVDNCIKQLNLSYDKDPDYCQYSAYVRCTVPAALQEEINKSYTCEFKKSIPSTPCSNATTDSTSKKDTASTSKEEDDDEKTTKSSSATPCIPQLIALLGLAGLGAFIFRK